MNMTKPQDALYRLLRDYGIVFVGEGVSTDISSDSPDNNWILMLDPNLNSDIEQSLYNLLPQIDTEITVKSVQRIYYSENNKLVTELWVYMTYNLKD